MNRSLGVPSTENHCIFGNFFLLIFEPYHQPIKILLIGEGIFRRISFDLPRTEENELSKIYDLVKMNYENEGIQEELSQTSIENEAERLIILEGREKIEYLTLTMSGEICESLLA